MGTGWSIQYKRAKRESAEPRFSSRRIALAAWALLVAVTLMVQARLLAPLDGAALQWIVSHRPAGVTEAMDWLFRMGFAQVDAAIALVWAAWLVWRERGHLARPDFVGPAAYQGGGGQAPALRRSLVSAKRLLPATAPLVLLLAIFLQAGMRLVVNQPAPGSAYELQRDFASGLVGLALDRTDATARQLFVAATAPRPTDGGSAPTGTGRTAAFLGQGAVRGSYPSGHACRVMFLSLLAAGMIRGRGKARRAASLVVALLPTALIGYSVLYFGYHWPSDLLGGILLALGLYPVARAS